ncbi:molecular chaperone GrpE [Rhizobiales bacterium GAS113]|nr:molecular chaperone GrpE [Rhizobiales bacterium GAS113]
MARDDLDDKVRTSGPPSAEVAVEPTTLEAENASLRDRLLRSLADAENTRRRAERSVADARQYAISNFATELLTVVDNLDRALASADDQPQLTPGDAALLDGVRATQRLLMATLERFGVRKIDALGAPFDPALHEAMTEVDDVSRSPRSIVRVLEDGYTIHDRLLRAARVIITKPRPEPTSPVDAAPAQ